MLREDPFRARFPTRPNVSKSKAGGSGRCWQPASPTQSYSGLPIPNIQPSPKIPTDRSCPQLRYCFLTRSTLPLAPAAAAPRSQCCQAANCHMSATQLCSNFRVQLFQNTSASSCKGLHLSWLLDLLLASFGRLEIFLDHICF